MTTLIRRLVIVASFFGAFAACVNDTPPKTTENTPSFGSSSVNGPDGKELLKLLQGLWTNATDPMNQLSFSNDTLRILQHGQVVDLRTLDISVTCQTAACQVDSVGVEDGWCFIEKGALDAQCNLVLKADADVLEYRMLGSETPTQTFNKAKQ